MKKHTKKILVSLSIFSVLGAFSLFANAEESNREVLMADANIGNIEVAKGVQGFAYLDGKQEVIPFLELEIKKQEEEKKREEERLQKIEEERLKKIAEEKKRKAEAEKAKKIAEQKAKEEAERKAKAEKEEAEREARELAEIAARKASEDKARATAIAEEKKRQANLKNANSTPKTTTVTKPVSKPATTANTSDLDALAKIIHAEANNQPYQGKVAVAAVILNRVSDGRFPSSIQGVITAPGQFQPVSNGAYQNARPNNSDYSAAREALAGADPTGGATFFYAPSIATTSWHETLTPTVTIGGHKFFKN